ncbi:MAG: 2-methylcitrate dehydratase, partial [Tepidisphaeraceae bacterium]
EYPIGHRRRRSEGMPLLIEKFKRNLVSRFPAKKCEKILAASMKQKTLEGLSVAEYVNLYVTR